MAKLVVNSLVVARYEWKAQTFKAKVLARAKRTDTTSTICFVTVDSKKVEGVSKFYSDIHMIGKHYLIRAMSQRDVKRHYTVSNSMETVAMN